MDLRVWPDGTGVCAGGGLTDGAGDGRAGGAGVLGGVQDQRGEAGGA